MASQPLYILTNDFPAETPQTPEKPSDDRDGTTYTGGSFEDAPPQTQTPTTASPEEPIVIGKKPLKRVPVDVKMLKAQMSGMIGILEEIFAEAEQKRGIQLKEVELSVEINGAGEVSLLGTGASLENTGAITLTFTRNP